MLVGYQQRLCHFELVLEAANRAIDESAPVSVVRVLKILVTDNFGEFSDTVQLCPKLAVGGTHREAVECIDQARAFIDKILGISKSGCVFG